MNANNSSIQLGSTTTTSSKFMGSNLEIDGFTYVKTETPIFEVNATTNNSYFLLDETNNKIQVGGATNGQIIGYGSNTTFNANTMFATNTDQFRVNTSSEGAYILADNDVNGKSVIQIGVDQKTDNIDIYADEFQVTAPSKLELNTNVLEFNADSQTAYFELNKTENRITIGRSELETTRVHGSNVYIGEPNGNTVIYGNIVAYSAGCNIITQTAVQETSAFKIHNTGTQPAMYVVQDNSIGTSEDLAMFVTSSNQDRTPFRIDGYGRVGMGLPQKEGPAGAQSNLELKAWLHINRNDPDNTERNDILRVDDTDYDNTPFIIKNNGDVGIGTYAPEYKLDVWKDPSSSSSSAIALRDTVYIKQNLCNKIMYCMGNARYVPAAATDEFTSKFKFSWSNDDTSVYDGSSGSYGFRVSVKFHIANEDGNIAYRRFEVFVNPQSGMSLSDSRTSPAHVAITDVFDTVAESFEFVDFINSTSNPKVGNPSIVSLSDGKSCELKIKWKSAEVKTCRSYIDIEILAHENLGDITVIPVTPDCSGSGSVYLD